MTMGLADAGRHLTDADLVRHIDDEGDAPDRRRRGEHLAGCDACAAQVTELREQSGAVRAWLERTTYPAPVSPRSTIPASRPRSSRRHPGLPPWLKAAAVILVLATPLAAIPAVRDWVVERIPSVRSDGPSRDRPVATRADAGVMQPVLRFVPAGGSFAVDFDAAQATGVLTLARVEGQDAVLEMSAPAARPGTVVSARGLRIENDAASTASYALRLPAAVTDVAVTIEGRPVRVGAGEIDRERTVPLQAAPVR